MDANGPSANGTDSIDSSPGGDTVDSLDPAPPRAAGRGWPSWRRGGTVLVAVVALVVGGALGASIAGGATGTQELAASSDPSADDDAVPEDGDRRGHGMLRGHGPGPFFGHGLFGGLHGSYVVEDPDGGYRTMVTQRGEVTAVSDTSLTVRSEDGYDATYRLTDDTLVLGGTEGAAALEDGDEVAVAGVRTGDGTRALHVADLSQMQELRWEHGPRELPAPTPSETTTTGSSSA